MKSPTSMQVSRDGQELASSQGTPNCCGSADVIHSGHEEDELLSDVRRRLWKDVFTRQAASHVGSPLQNAHTTIEAWSQSQSSAELMSDVGNGFAW